MLSLIGFSSVRGAGFALPCSSGHQPTPPFQVAVLEQSAEQTVGLWSDQQRVGLGDRLQPGGKVGGLANCRVLLRHALAHEISDNDHAARDANARL